jgi:hypothetical protein
MPKVFISYANDDPDWPAGAVETLADRLLARSLKVDLDLLYRQELGREPADSEWTDWAIARVGEATQVLCLVSPLYTERARQDRPNDPRGRGLAVEIEEIKQRLKRNKQRNLGEIFILKREGSEIPPFLRGRCPEYVAPHGESMVLQALSHGAAAGDLADLIRRQLKHAQAECTDLYVPLEGVGRGLDRPMVRLPQSVSSCMTFRPSVWTRFSDVTQAIDRKTRAVVVGDPGSGKTLSLLKILEDDSVRLDAHMIGRFERWLALEVALDAAVDPDLLRDPQYRANLALQQRELDALGQEIDPLCIPVFVRLRAWTSPDMAFDAFLATQAPELGPGIRRWFQAGKVRLLLDGINELPQRTESSRQMASLLDWLDGGQGSFIVTTRNTLELPERLPVLRQTIHVEPLRAKQIRQFVESYLRDADAPVDAQRVETVFWHIVGPNLRAFSARRSGETDADFNRLVAGELTASDDWESEATYQAYLEVCSDPGRRYALATNPYMLAMLLWVHCELDVEPSMSRVELFERYLGARMADEIRKTHRDLTVEEMHGHLTDLAVELQDIGWQRTGQGRGHEQLSVPVAIETPQQQAIVDVGVEARIIRHEGGAVAFNHQLLQEYYVARFMQEQWSRGRTSFAAFVDDVVARETERSAWEETFVLLAEHCPRDVDEIVIALVNIQPEIAASVWERTRLRSPKLLSSALQVRVQAALQRRAFAELASQEDAHAAGRAALALGRMHGLDGRLLDARPGVSGWYDATSRERVVDIAWVRLNGSGGSEELGLQIAKYPITVGQFRVFLEDPEGYANPRWWLAGHATGEKIRSISADLPSNLPCFSVTWHEAMAFCAWLSSALQCVVRLPTPAEWILAAAGPEARLYPWGTAWMPYAANAAGLFRGPVAVGMLARGATPDGIYDLAGNVLEWVDSGSRPDKQGFALGGCWSSGDYFCRNHVKAWYAPGQRHKDIGFRVLRDDRPTKAAKRPKAGWFERLSRKLRDGSRHSEATEIARQHDADRSQITAGRPGSGSRSNL